MEEVSQVELATLDDGCDAFALLRVDVEVDVRLDAHADHLDLSPNLPGTLRNGYIRNAPSGIRTLVAGFLRCTGIVPVNNTKGPHDWPGYTNGAYNSMCGVCS